MVSLSLLYSVMNFLFAEINIDFSPVNGKFVTRTVSFLCVRFCSGIVSQMVICLSVFIVEVTMQVAMPVGWSARPSVCAQLTFQTANNASAL